MLAGEWGTDDFRRGQLQAAVEGAAPTWLLAEHCALRQRLNTEEPVSVEGAEELLVGLRAAGLRLAILTNGTGELAHAKLARLGLTHHVDATLVADELPAPKPDPLAYAAAADALDLPPEEVSMVGDHLEWDVIAPLRAGYAQALWLWRPDAPPPGAVPPGAKLVRTLADVPAALGIASGT